MKNQFTVGLLGIALFTASSAFAYVPPSAYIVKSIANKHAGVKGLRIKSVATAMDGEKLTSTRIKVTTYYNPLTTTLRAYALNESNQRLYGVERKAASATAADALLFWSNGKAVASALKSRGIPIRTEEELEPVMDPQERLALEQQSLARWANSVAWVIGKTSEPQLWVEKDTFLPLRLIAASGPQGSDGRNVDLQMEGQRFYHEFPFPRVIVAVLKNQQPVLRDEVQEVALVLDAAEFRASAPNGFTDAGNSAPSATRDLIRQYFELIR